jgi:hypothetical protein
LGLFKKHPKKHPEKTVLARLDRAIHLKSGGKDGCPGQAGAKRVFGSVHKKRLGLIDIPITSGRP